MNLCVQSFVALTIKFVTRKYGAILKHDSGAN